MSPFTAIVMTKEPRPGAVKTRLTAGEGALQPVQAAAVAEAMLRCIVERLRRRGPVLLAADPAGSSARLAHENGWDLEVADQGPGTLGERLDRVWASCSGPVAFFGIDSPDVPDTYLDAIGQRLRDADVLYGPTDDGGFWTLAAVDRHRAVLAEIDWGTEVVLDQSLAAARMAGLSSDLLPPWHDVDTPSDLRSLIDRLDGTPCEHRARLNHCLRDLIL